MSEGFVGKVIVILSPQPWNHLHISKHHYARTLAAENTVYFVAPPAHSYQVSHSARQVEPGLFELNYSIPGPYWMRFKLLTLYKLIIRLVLPRVLIRYFREADFCFEFGCYKQFDTVAFIPARYRIYFPVDDFSYLKPRFRGCDLVLTVSRNIQRKFQEGVCHFINHGLAGEFAKIAADDLTSGAAWRPSGRTRACYAGNLFSRFMDFQALKEIIASNSAVEFHLFGNREFDPTVAAYADWDRFLANARNVILHGQVSTERLAEAYRTMDVFLLCYKPDHAEYHGENSHKLLEYLSTGRTVVSSFIYTYERTGLIVMPNDFENEKISALFSEVVANLAAFNSQDKMNARRAFALKHTYRQNVRTIAGLIRNDAAGAPALNEISLLSDR